MEEDDDLLQAQTSNGQAPEVAPELASRINSFQSGGQPLPQPARAFFEPRFGADFSHVRVHTNAQAAASAKALNAKAYTLGQNVVFGGGQYQPGTRQGRRLLAHELTHVVQQAPGIFRTNEHWSKVLRFQTSVAAEPIPAPEIETRGPLWERARSYEPPMRPPLEHVPTIPSPPIPQTPSSPATCPDAETIREEIRTNDIVEATERRMRYSINLERSRGAFRQPFRLTQTLIRQSDRAIRAAFGTMLPSGRNLASHQAITTRTPSQFAQLRIPNEQAARQRIARVAIQTSPDILRSLCILEPTHSILLNEVATPLLSRLGMNFVREYERIRIGGQTTHSYSGGSWSRHIDIPNQHRHIGHILVHEGMHYYVNDEYYGTANGHPLEEQLIEEGAEALARHVINQRLNTDPAFRINTATYSSEFHYVQNHFMRGGLSSFALAYFQGRVDLLGITPRSVPTPELSSGIIQRKENQKLAPNRLQPQVSSSTKQILHLEAVDLTAGAVAPWRSGTNVESGYFYPQTIQRESQSRAVREIEEQSHRMEGDPVRSSPNRGASISNGTLTWELRNVGDLGSIRSDGAIVMGMDVEMRARFTATSDASNCPTITFLQTVIATTGSIPSASHLLFTRESTSGASVDVTERDTEPYYGVEPVLGGAGLQPEPSTRISGAGRTDAATFRDTPMWNSSLIPPGQTLVREFELAVICVETGETFGSLRWGYTKTREGLITLTGAQAGDLRSTAASPQLESIRLSFYSGFFQHTLSGFSRGSASLLRDHRTILRNIAALPNVRRILLVGANDFSRGPEANTTLSLRRAERARDYLVRHRVDQSVITVEGHGVASRVANLPGQQVAANRRVDIHIDRGRIGESGGGIGSPVEAQRLRRQDPRLTFGRLIDLLIELQSRRGNLPRTECNQLTHIVDALRRWRRIDPSVPDVIEIYGPTIQAVRRRCSHIPRAEFPWLPPPLRP